ncbi:MAG: zf-TFIIB domain-containing protein [Myxococcales bacterium]|nr:zf-TFIIB domain-containing protein [Myxococcales bacterium]
MTIGRGGMFMFGFAAGLMLPVAVVSMYLLRFRPFRPGMASYDRALGEDIITTLAHQGIMKMDVLAEHLGIGDAHLGRVLFSLRGPALAPLYHDKKNNQLISLHAAEVDDRGCPACGGQLSVARRASLQCQHCGGLFFGS